MSKPLPVELAVAGAVRVSELRSAGERLFAIVQRPGSEASNLVMVGLDATLTPVLSDGEQARSTVNEYGGGVYAVHADEDSTRIVYSRGVDQRLATVELAHGAAEDLPLPASAMTFVGHPHSSGPDARWADLVITPDGEFVVGVRERHVPTGVVLCEVAAIHVASGQVSILAAGNDFYSSPRVSPDGDELCWVSWDAPAMPWQSTSLWSAELVRFGHELDISEPVIVAGGDDESVLDPTFAPDGRLFYVSDVASSSAETGEDRFWNLMLRGTAAPVWRGPFEISRPHWVFGMSRLRFVNDQTLVSGITDMGSDRLVLVDVDTGRERVLDPSISQVESVAVLGDTAVVAAATARRGQDIALIPLGENVEDPSARWCIEATPDAEADVAQPIAFVGPATIATNAFGETVESSDCFGWLTMPARGRENGVLPPLLVMAHGGPTSMVECRLDMRKQFWTTRGFAVLDVNYRGSTGFGRRYRSALDGRWGELDVADCIAGARHLADRGIVHPERMVIRGSSSGGLTVLNALRSGTFAGGTTLYGVTDLGMLAEDTHRFEQHYIDGLIGPWPAARAIYDARSPIRHLDEVHVPVLVFHGEADAVVPIEQAEVLVDGLRSHGVRCEFHHYPEEGHGFRSAEVLAATLTSEAAFYASLWSDA